MAVEKVMKALEKKENEPIGKRTQADTRMSNQASFLLKSIIQALPCDSHCDADDKKPHLRRHCDKQTKATRMQIYVDRDIGKAVIVTTIQMKIKQPF